MGGFRMRVQCACAHGFTSDNAPQCVRPARSRAANLRPLFRGATPRRAERQSGTHAKRRGRVPLSARLQTVAGAFVPHATPRQFSGSAYVAGVPRLSAWPSHKTQSLKKCGHSRRRTREIFAPQQRKSHRHIHEFSRDETDMAFQLAEVPPILMRVSTPDNLHEQKPDTPLPLPASVRVEIWLLGKVALQCRLMREGALRSSFLLSQRALAPWRKTPRQQRGDLGVPVTSRRRQRVATTHLHAAPLLPSPPCAGHTQDSALAVLKSSFEDAKNRSNENNLPHPLVRFFKTNGILPVKRIQSKPSCFKTRFCNEAKHAKGEEDFYACMTTKIIRSVTTLKMALPLVVSRFSHTGQGSHGSIPRRAPPRRRRSRAGRL